MKKWTWVVVVITVIVIVVIAINKGKNTSNIKVGATLSLTGSLASIGKSELNGLIMAAEEINKSGGVNGRKIEVIAEDNQGDPKFAVTNVQKLLSIDNVNVMFSAFTPMTKAIAPILKEKNMPMIYASTDGSIASGTDLFFRDYFDAEQSGITLFKKVRTDGQKSAKIISEQSESCILFINAFKNAAIGSDVKIKDETYFQPTEKDFKAYLTKLNLKKEDVIIACAFKQPFLIKNMADLGLINNQSYQIVAPFLSAANEPGFRELFSKNKTVSTWYGFAEKNNTAKQEEFIKNYKQRFNEPPLADSAFAYDDMYILSSVLSKCVTGSSINNVCFKSEMSKINYDGVAGKVSFDAQGRSNRETLLIQAVDNQWVTIK